jgi:nucleoside-diphosphate-sugar epimerase
LSILIVGCGYLGERVAARCLAAGQRVFATTRRPDRAEELRRLGVEPVVCDVLGAATVPAFPEVDVVLYAVGYDRGGAGGLNMRDVYVVGLANVVEKLPLTGRLLYASSTGVYGQVAGEGVDETAATEPVEEGGKVVLAAEELLRQRRPDAVRLRFAGMYGPGRLLRRQAVTAGEPIVGDPEKWLNLIHIDDAVTAVLAAARARPGEIYNVADDLPARRREFYTRLAELLGAPPPRFVAAALGTEATNRRVVNRRLRQELGVALRYPSFVEGLPASV